MIVEGFLLTWLHLCALKYNVDPGLAYGVMIIESRGQCGELGRKGTFIGPMGIHKCFRSKWDIDNPYTNIEVGVRALRGDDERRVLRRYNTAFNMAYYKAVKQVQRDYNRRMK